MKKLILLCISLVILAHADAQKRTDAFEKLNQKEKSMIKSFSGVKIAGEMSESNENVLIETINADQVKQLMARSKYTWLSVCSSTCSYCKQYIPYYLNLALKFPDLSIVLVELDYKPRQIQKQVLESKYRGTVYILDRETHGNMYLKRHADFTAEVCKTCADRPYTPHNMFFDSKGDLIKQITSSLLINSDTLLKYLPLTQ